MRKFFQYINRKPKAVRDNYAFGIAVTFTGIILMFWVIARPSGEVIVSKTETPPSPFATLIKETKEKFSQLGSSNNDKSQNENSQSATLINSSTTMAEDLILNEEDIEKAKQDLEKVSETNTTQVSNNYTEVMIGTTSASVKLIEENCITASTSSSDIETNAPCSGSTMSSSTTVQ